MWILKIVLLSCLITALLAADEHRPKKKDSSSLKDNRGKRNLQYSISHQHFNGPPAIYHHPLNFRAERRISTSSQHHPYQFFPTGPRPYSPYHNKGRPSFPIPPYAVQMEPLIHYSQRDPLYDTNILSLNTDGHNDLTKDDLLTDTNHLNENIYGPPPEHKQIIERPVYIKEPEPIIEIIIKESNVTLPPQPAPPTPPPQKKKEQVQVFYVKYKKNPNGQGKDNIIYDKPIPAISPPIPDDEDHHSPQEHYQHHHEETITLPPPPSTTLRTVIRPDSETYHSPSGIKVTFGKEGFDYHKRSNKPTEDLKSAHSTQFPQGRQLSSFPTTNFNSRPRPRPNFQFPQSPPSFQGESNRPPQQYRPFNQPPPPFRQLPQPQFNNQYSTLPKYLQFQQPQFSKAPPSRPPPPVFNQQFPQQTQQSHPHVSHQVPQQPHPQQPQQPLPPHIRQPVPYQPFENLRPQPHQELPSPNQQIQFRHQTHFPIAQQLPLTQKPQNFNQRPQEQPQHPIPLHQQPLQYNQPSIYPQNPQQANIQNHRFENNQDILRLQEQVREGQLNLPQLQPQHQFQQSHAQNYPKQSTNIAQPQRQSQQNSLRQPQQLNFQPQLQQQLQHHQPNQVQQNLQQSQQYFQQQQQHLQNQNIVPPGGELIQSVPKYEQHISIVESNQGQQPQALALQQSQQIHQQLPQQQVQQQQLQHQQVQQHQQIQQQIQQHQQVPQHHQLTQQNHITQSNYNQQIQQQANIYQQHQQASTAKPQIIYQTTQKPTTTTTTTTQIPEKISTTTKDPKVLNAQLPDEVPEDLRQQLLASGILNNADISILDYDKVGDIPLSALPPDQLANFYNAGGAQQLAAAGSEPVPAIAKPEPIEDDLDQEPEASEIQEVKATPEVQMKVVHYNPDTEQGQKVQETYVKKDATQIDPVVLNGEQYNRYLPLKVSGTQFPLPDVPELKGKKISSVVVLAPVTYDFSGNTRKTRDAKDGAKDLELIRDDNLKELLKNPTSENYKRFLDNENKTRSDKQAVILLVIGPNETNKEKEIFMYDVATQSVSKLSGELSAAFVEAAEANASPAPAEEEAASTIVETRVPYGQATDSESLDDDSLSDLETMEADGSDPIASVVDISGNPVSYADLDKDNVISDGFSKTGQLPSV